VELWLFVSVCYVVISYVFGWSWQSRYFPVAAASLPFAIGSAIHYASKSSFVIRQFNRLRISSNVLFLLMLFNCLIWMAVSRMKIGKFVEVGFYFNITICTLLVYSLAIGKEIISINKKMDKVIGDYSYPIYLLHWQCGLLVSFLIFGESIHEFSGRGFINLLAAIVCVVLISSLFIRGVDEPIQRVRSKIKANKALQRTRYLPQ
jgi:peptidoglycan/LPS O-acetylase OafA/YrhL